MAMILRVSGDSCAGCPMMRSREDPSSYEDGRLDYCGADPEARLVVNVCGISGSEPLAKSPDWCPLKSGGVWVKLKGGE